MKKLTHTSVKNIGQEHAFRKAVPFIAGAAALGLTLGVPGMSGAEQPRAQQCSASVEQGRITAHTSTTNRARVFRSPLLQPPDRYLQVTLPNAYVREISQAASGRPEAERQPFIASIVQDNVSAAMRALGTGRSATFACAPVTATATAAPVATPQPTQPSPPPTPAPTATSPPAQVAPAPSSSGSAGTDAPPQRRRVIQPGTVPAPAPSNKADAPKSEAPAAAVPFPVSRKGGAGTDKAPYVIEVPVASKAAAGSPLYGETFSYSFASSGNRTEKIYIALRFVSAGSSKVTSKPLLVRAIVPAATALMQEKLQAAGVTTGPSAGSINASVGVIINRARDANADVRAYAPDS